MDKTLEESARAVIWRCFLYIFDKFSKIHRKIFVLEPLFDVMKFQVLRPPALLKNHSNNSVFP